MDSGWWSRCPILESHAHVKATKSCVKQLSGPKSIFLNGQRKFSGKWFKISSNIWKLFSNTDQLYRGNSFLIPTVILPLQLILQNDDLSSCWTWHEGGVVSQSRQETRKRESEQNAPASQHDPHTSRTNGTSATGGDPAGISGDAFPLPSLGVTSWCVYKWKLALFHSIGLLSINRNIRKQLHAEKTFVLVGHKFRSLFNIRE